MGMLLSVRASKDLRPCPGVPLFGIVLVEMPNLALLVLDAMLMQIGIETDGAPPVVLGDGVDGHKVFALEDDVVIGNLRLHLGDLLLLRMDGCRQFLVFIVTVQPYRK